MWDDPVLYDLENADDPAFDLPFWTGVFARYQPRRVLELACGTGRLTLPLAALGVAEEIVGVDSSEPFLAAARDRLAASSPTPHPTSSAPPTTPVRFVAGDLRSLDGTVAGPFDLVTIPFNSLAYLHAPADRGAMLASVRALLATGGHFVIDVVAPRYDLLAEALAPDPEPQVDADHAAPDLGVDRFIRTCVDRYDPSTQTLHSHNRYEIHWTSGEVEHQESTLDWHITFPAELESELTTAGLRVTERFGGWNGEPWGPTARRIIWVCEPAP